jgi:hypothetical protein
MVKIDKKLNKMQDVQGVFQIDPKSSRERVETEANIYIPNKHDLSLSCVKVLWT